MYYTALDQLPCYANMDDEQTAALKNDIVALSIVVDYATDGVGCSCGWAIDGAACVAGGRLNLGVAPPEKLGFGGGRVGRDIEGD
jgi:hypothetical protein